MRPWPAKEASSSEVLMACWVASFSRAMAIRTGVEASSWARAGDLCVGCCQTPGVVWVCHSLHRCIERLCLQSEQHARTARCTDMTQIVAAVIQMQTEERKHGHALANGRAYMHSSTLHSCMLFTWREVQLVSSAFLQPWPGTRHLVFGANTIL